MGTHSVCARVGRTIQGMHGGNALWLAMRLVDVSRELYMDRDGIESMCDVWTSVL